MFKRLRGRSEPKLRSSESNGHTVQSLQSNTINNDLHIKWSASDVRRWLPTLGLQKHAPSFKRHHITGTKLLRLQLVDLPNLGITDVLEQRTLLQATAQVRAALHKQPSLAETSTLQDVHATAAEASQDQTRKMTALPSRWSGSNSSPNVRHHAGRVLPSTPPSTTIATALDDPTYSTLDDTQASSSRTQASTLLEDETPTPSPDELAALYSTVDKVKQAQDAQLMHAGPELPPRSSSTPKTILKAGGPSQDASSAPRGLGTTFRGAVRAVTAANTLRNPTLNRTTAQLQQQGHATADSVVHRVDEAAQQSSYYHDQASRHDAREAVERRGGVGTFAVTMPGSSAGRSTRLLLSVLWAEDEVHQLTINNTPDGLRVGEEPQTFETLSALVSYYSQQPLNTPSGSLLLTKPAFEPTLRPSQPSPQPSSVSAVETAQTQHGSSWEHLKRETPWYYGYLSQQSARAVLQFERDGCFLVRKSTPSAPNDEDPSSALQFMTSSNPNLDGAHEPTHELLYVHRSTMYSRKLEMSATNVRLHGTSACFEDLNTLIHSYSVMQSDDLPVRLAYSPGAVPGDRVRLSTNAAGYSTTTVAMDTFLTTVIPDHTSVSWWASSAIDAKRASMETAQAVNGAFFARHGGRAGAFILTYVYEGDLHSDCILSYTNTQAQFMLYLSSAGRSLSFPTLRHLVHYYSSASRDLLCPLRLPEARVRSLASAQRAARPPPLTGPATRALSPILDVSEPASPAPLPYAPTLAREPRRGRSRTSSASSGRTASPGRKFPPMMAVGNRASPGASTPSPIPILILRGSDDPDHESRTDEWVPKPVQLNNTAVESRSTPMLSVSEAAPRSLRRTLSSELDATMAAERQLRPILKSPAKLKKSASEPQRVARVNFADDLEQIRRMSPAPDWAWYQVGKPRYLATSALRGTPEGSFVIRRSESQPACFALTYKANGKFRDELIILPSGHLTGPDVHLFSLPQHRFPNLESLIDQFSLPGSPLVCPLSIPTSFAAQSKPRSVSSRHSPQSAPVSHQHRPALRSVPLPRGGSAPHLLSTSSSIVRSPTRSPLTTTATTLVSPSPHGIPPRPRQRHSAPQIVPPRSTPRSRSRRARNHIVSPSSSGDRTAVQPGASNGWSRPMWMDADALRSPWCLLQARSSDAKQAEAKLGLAHDGAFLIERCQDRHGSNLIATLLLTASGVVYTIPLYEHSQGIGFSGGDVLPTLSTFVRHYAQPHVRGLPCPLQP
eukprot:m.242209 g.242209  ORF g.242209 m.242209 type:complete len:1239 (-) comp17454_c0_seq1:104-3820(-)